MLHFLPSIGFNDLKTVLLFHHELGESIDHSSIDISPGIGDPKDYSLNSLDPSISFIIGSMSSTNYHSH